MYVFYPISPQYWICSEPILENYPSFNFLPADYSIGRNGEVTEESSRSEDESGQNDASYNV